MIDLMIRSVFIERVSQAIANKNRFGVHNCTAHIYHNPGLLENVSKMYKVLGKDTYVIFASDSEGFLALRNRLRKRIQMGDSLVESMELLYKERSKEYIKFIKAYLLDQCKFKIDVRSPMKSQMADYFEY